MQRLNLDKDIAPLSDFRARTALYIHQTHSTKRPIVITQHGKGAAVLLDVGEYERMIERMELLEDVRVGEKQIVEGKGIPHNKALKLALQRVMK